MNAYLITHSSPKVCPFALGSHDFGLASLLFGLILLLLELGQFPVIVLLQLVV